MSRRDEKCVICGLSWADEQGDLCEECRELLEGVASKPLLSMQDLAIALNAAELTTQELLVLMYMESRDDDEA